MSKKRKVIREWIKAAAVAILVVGFIRFFLLTPIFVDGYSMMPTLKDNERLLVNKVSYVFKEPKRFDIIVFRDEEGREYIKRIIGLPGDTVEYRDDILYINGKPYKEKYLKKYKQQLIDGGPLTEPFTLSDSIGRKTVPENHLFVLGDNRRYSKDSRHIGVISYDRVLGKASLVFSPVKDTRFVK
ncbi:signal peptidase I [Bacillus massiliglaciei]|uniref:signal peptidase I n=1 Tax=Bacillus massiliglaciei TaxID=1816693 RepID=UPI000A3E26E1|nr:signal peptidase I [Bacillus massiliglaciei]